MYWECNKIHHKYIQEKCNVKYCIILSNLMEQYCKHNVHVYGEILHMLYVFSSVQCVHMR